MQSVGVVLGLAIFSIVQPAQAGEIKSKDWTWNIDDTDSVYAATMNSADHMLAQFCYPETGKCLYAVAFGTNCEEGSKYPALVNADEGAYYIELVCGDKMDGQHLMFVSDFDQIDKIVRSSERIGIVMPMQGDEFKAVRFSLRGATEALDSMRSAAQKLHARQSSKPSVRPAVERL